MIDKNKILVGKIVAPQGIRGDVRVQTYTASPMDLQNMSVCTDKFGAHDFKFIRRLNPTSDVIVAHIRGVDDRNAAETLRGTELFVARDGLPALGANEYYQTDLIGFDVIRGDEQIGRIACFQNFGAGDIIELEDGEMISFVGADVDLAARRVYVK